MTDKKVTPHATASCTSTEALMEGKNQLIIMHEDQRYILRITRNGKLILTK